MNEFRTAYGQRLQVGLDCSEDPGKTLQSAKDECDINRIIRRYRDTGVITHLVDLEAQYGDVTGIDYQSALLLVENARGLFSQLPAEVRSKFKNDPAVFLDFCDDPTNADELVEMGLATKKLVKELQEGKGAGEGTPEEGVSE